jgi:hypothetical protein
VSWPIFLLSILVPGAGFALRRDLVTFALVFATVGLSYASYHVLVSGFSSLAWVPTPYHYLPVIGVALHVGAAVRSARPEPRRKA